MQANASQPERILCQQLNCEVVNPPNIADVLDEFSNLAEREFQLATINIKRRCKGTVMWRMRTERNLSQHQSDVSGRFANVTATRQHLYGYSLQRRRGPKKVVDPQHSAAGACNVVYVATQIFAEDNACAPSALCHGQIKTAVSAQQNVASSVPRPTSRRCC